MKEYEALREAIAILEQENTALRLQAQNLEEDMGRLEAFLDAVPAGVLIKGESSPPLFVNKHLREAFGSIRDGEDGSRFRYQDGDPGFKSQDGKSLWEGDPESQETIVRPDGTARIFKAFRFPIARKRHSPLVGCLVLDSTEQVNAEKALSRSEERYRTLFEQAREMIVITDRQGQIIDVNRSALSVLGYTRHEMLNMSYRDLLFSLGREKEFFQELENQGYVKDFEDRIRKKDGSPLDCLLTVAEVVDDAGRIQLCQGILHDITERKKAEARIFTLTRRLLKTQENERRRLSRDLHDNVAQALSALRLETDMLFQNVVQHTPEHDHAIKEFMKRLDQTIVDVRHLAYDLRPPMLDDLGLVRTVAQYCSDFARTCTIPVDFYSAGLENLKLPGDIEINIFRLIQEALANIRRHAEATEVIVRMVASFPNVIVRIEDNGRGFDVERRLGEALHEQRMGLKNMNERICLLRGTMRIRSHPARGTQIYVEIPCQEKILHEEKDSDR